MGTPTFVTCSFEVCQRARKFKNTGLCQSHQKQHLSGEPLRELRRFKEFGEVAVCGHDGCGAASRTRGYCTSHYLKFLRKGFTYGEGSEKNCSYPGCSGPVSARKLCELHYAAPHDRSIPCHIPGCDRKGQYGFCTTHTTRARRFGMTPRELQTFISRGKCDACGTPGFNHDIHHDHSCCDTSGRSCGGCVIAYLCSNCNRAAGQAKDDPTVLRAIALILENNKPAFPGKEKTGSWRN